MEELHVKFFRMFQFALCIVIKGSVLWSGFFNAYPLNNSTKPGGSRKFRGEFIKRYTTGSNILNIKYDFLKIIEFDSYMPNSVTNYW